MLKELSIKNFALIRELKFSPNVGFNIITGETGAGKSIILDALSLILGERADSKVQVKSGLKCVIEGVFVANNIELKNIFQENDIDWSEETIVRREINDSGKSRHFVNDTPVALSLLKLLSPFLVDVHSQHENTGFNRPEFQMQLLDGFCDCIELSREFTVVFKQYKKLQAEITLLERQQEELFREKDYLVFLTEELENASLKPDEEEELETELMLLSNAEEILINSKYAASGLYGEEASVTDKIADIKGRLKGLVVVNNEIAEIVKRLDSLAIEAKDIASELDSLQRHISANPQRLQEVNDRLAQLQGLLRKHHVQNVSELINLHQDYNKKLSRITIGDSFLSELKEKQDALLQIIKAKGAELSEKRKKGKPHLEQKVKELLTELEMPAASFTVQLEQLPDNRFADLGFDEVRFYFSANKGIAEQPLHKIASGGELSRLALCFKTILADKNEMPTIIFDEIDTGVSGEVAQRMGMMMKSLSFNHQVITITHLPQVASKADSHFFVFKLQEEDTTVSGIKLLNEDERVNQIAIMLSGNNPGSNAIAAAKELINQYE